MSPLTYAGIGEENTVKRIGGSEEVKRHLETLGFTAGSSVTVVSTLAGSVIVNVRGARVAIGKDMAMKIMI